MGDGQGSSVSLSADGMTVAIGASAAPSGSNRGLVKIYTYDGSSWSQKGTNLIGEADGDAFGAALSLSDDGNTIAIGSPLKDLNSSFVPNGRVQVYDWSGAAWVQKGSNIDGIADFENLGESISLSGDGTRLAIGIPGKDTNGGDPGGETGAVHVYEFSTDWTLLGSEIAGVEDYSSFGISVSLNQDGSTLAVGAPLYSAVAWNAGQVTVYRYNGASWEAKGSTLSTFNGEEEDFFGQSVNLSNDGNRIAIGAPDSFLGAGPTYFGYVEVWDYAAESWTQVGSDIVSSIDGDSFGQEIALSGSGSHLVIGAVNNVAGNENGRAEVYTFGSAWEQVGASIVGEANEDVFGSAVAISVDGSIAAAGAYGNDDGGTDAGHVRVLEFALANDPPVITAGQSFNVNENAANSTSVGIVLATDPDAGTTFSDWTITFGNGDGVFAINSSSGEITVVDNTNLDFETTTNYTLTLTVSDGVNTSVAEEVTIAVTDVDDGKYSGGSGTLEDPYQIASEGDLRELSATSEDWGAHFIQTEDITMSDENFHPIAVREQPFKGSYDGNDHFIDNLRVNQNTSGLFRAVNSQYFIKDLTVTSIYVGPNAFNSAVLVWEVTGSDGGVFEISNVHVSGTPRGSGLITNVTGGTVSIYRCTSDIVSTNSSNNNDGGLIGSISTDATKVSIIESAFFGAYNGSSGIIGGLVGSNYSELEIIRCYNAGDVSNSLASGMLGYIFGDGSVSITDSYNSGNLSGSNSAGFVGSIRYLEGSISIKNCFSIGSLSESATTKGPFIGIIVSRTGEEVDISIENSFWDTETTGISESIHGGEGLPTVEMKDLSTYANAGWDFANTWTVSCTEVSYPLLQAFQECIPVLVSIDAPAELISAVFQVTFNFSSDVTGFELADVIVTNGSASGLNMIDARTYSVDITVDSPADVVIEIEAGAAEGIDGGPSFARSVTVAFDLLTNVNEEVQLIYPNPSPGMVTVEGAKDLDRVEVYNLGGQLLRTQAKVIINEKMVLNLEDLPDGIYQLRIYTNDKESTHRIVLKK